MIGRLHEPPGADPRQLEWARCLAEEYMDVVTAGIQAHPRSHQRLIGPSELGVPCQRALLHKLNKDPEPDRGPAWKPAVGTALHAQMEEWFSGREEWLVEQRVDVGMIGPEQISGSTDLFYRAGAVIDHKFVGKTRLLHYRAHGPGEQYRVQAHTYGRGWAALGYPVQMVMIAFVPRDGELADSYFWWEPYDPMVALVAFAQANRLYRRLQEVGLAAALAEFQPCDDQWCPWCAPGNAVDDARQTNPFAISS